MKFSIFVQVALLKLQRLAIANILVKVISDSRPENRRCMEQNSNKMESDCLGG